MSVKTVFSLRFGLAGWSCLGRLLVQVALCPASAAAWPGSWLKQLPTSLALRRALHSKYVWQA